MSILFGSDKIGSIYVDTDKIGKIYVDTDLVYTSAQPAPVPSDWIIYNADPNYLTYYDDPDYPTLTYCELGHSWSPSDPRCVWHPNDFNRPVYTACGKYDFSTYSTTGKIRLFIDGNSSYQDLQHNAHFVGSLTPRLTEDYDQMHVTIERGANSCYLKFGVLPFSAPDSMDASNGGYLSSLLSPTYGEGTYSITIPSGIISANRMYPIINIRGSAKLYSYIDIKKIWFTHVQS